MEMQDWVRQVEQEAGRVQALARGHRKPESEEALALGALANTLGSFAKAAATVGVIHEHQFPPVGVRLFQRRKFPRLGPERLVVGGCGRCEQGNTEVQRGDPAGRFELYHSSITLLLSPNFSVSIPMR